jgi:pantothenate kinase
LAKHLVAAFNALAASTSPDRLGPAICISMDGFHYSRAQLDAMPDPAEAHHRRGAAFTFDAEAYAALIAELRSPIEPGRDVLAPSFDHAVKDPVADDVRIAVTHRIVVVEGNYVALAAEPWGSAARMLDEVVFVSVDFDTATERLIARHVKAGIVRSEEEGLERARANDLVNGREIVANLLTGKQIHTIVSREDEEWRAAGG